MELKLNFAGKDSLEVEALYSTIMELKLNFTGKDSIEVEDSL